jgi:hypothetical protein
LEQSRRLKGHGLAGHREPEMDSAQERDGTEESSAMFRARRLNDK